ncbi:MAG: NAD-dependent epimerase [Geobacteraceae bacterium]|nr:NAD-dependent epimerase [Geobacteraceae bacterium]
MNRVLVTGAAGFIGFHLSKRLLSDGFQVVAIDNLNDYYDPSLKKARLSILESSDRFSFNLIDISDRLAMADFFAKNSFDAVLHMAAQAGVRYSLVNPHVYADSNLTGFLNVLEGCRNSGTGHLVYASSSSVYGANTTMPFSVHQNVDHPLSLYAATKKANELMAHTYSALYGIPTTGLRFFTVYGPWGRPDMALFLFTRAILEGKPIDIFNNGMMERDFTYVDDIVEGIVRVMMQPATPDPAWSSAAPDSSSAAAPYRIYNIGNSKPVQLTRFIELLEKAIGKKAFKNLLPMQPGDLPSTYADISELSDAIGFSPDTPLETGVARFVEWYRQYYKV